MEETDKVQKTDKKICKTCFFANYWWGFLLFFIFMGGMVYLQCFRPKNLYVLGKGKECHQRVENILVREKKALELINEKGRRLETALDSENSDAKAKLQENVREKKEVEACVEWLNSYLTYLKTVEEGKDVPSPCINLKFELSDSGASDDRIAMVTHLLNRSSEAAKCSEESVQKVIDNAHYAYSTILAIGVLLIGTVGGYVFNKKKFFNEAEEDVKKLQKQFLKNKNEWNEILENFNKEKDAIKNTKDKIDEALKNFVNKITTPLQNIPYKEGLQDINEKLSQEEIDRIQDMVEIIREFEPFVGLLDIVDRAKVLQFEGYSLKHELKYNKSIRKYEEAVEFYKKKIMIDDTADNFNLMFSLGTCYYNMGVIYKAQSEFDESLENFEKCAQIMEKLIATNENNCVWKKHLGASWGCVGAIQEEQGKLKEALKNYEKCRKIMEELVTNYDDNDDNDDWKKILAISWGCIGTIQEKQGKQTRALNSYGERMKIMKKLVEDGEGNDDWKRELAVSWCSVGEIQMQQEKQGEALNSYGEGLKIMKKLVEKDEDNDDWKSVLAYSHMKLGELRERKAEWKDALEHYERAYEIREKLFEKAKENADWKREYCVSLYLVGGAYGQKPETWEKGKEMCGKAVELARELVKKEYIVIHWYYSLASALWKQGDVENREINRDTVEIRKLWEEALTIVDEKLLSKAPEYWYYKELKVKLEKGLAELDQS